MRSLKKLVEVYEKNFSQYGDNNKGVGWKSKKAANKRYQVVSTEIKKDKNKKSILDFGCGLSHFLKFIKRSNIGKFKYIGLDMSEKMIEASIKKYPKEKYIMTDPLKNPRKVPRADYIVILGLFTQKLNYSEKEMFSFLKRILTLTYNKTKVALIFNVMSPYVDWKNKFNFYLDFEKLLNFICKKLSKNFTIKHNYGLYEYTIFIYKKNK